MRTAGHPGPTWPRYAAPALPEQPWLTARRLQNKSRATEMADLHSRDFQSLPVVVVVDDEPVIALTLTEILFRNGFYAIWFTEALEALSFLGACPADLLLTDLMMPTMNGISLSEIAHQLQPSCLLFLLSANANDIWVHESIMKSGLPIHLDSKPLCPKKMIETIHTMLLRTAAG